MKITGTAIKLGAFSLVLLLFTVMIIVVFGQMRFDRTNGYSAMFNNASGLRAGQFVRASGVEVGKVGKVELINGGHGCGSTSTSTARCRCTSGTTAAIRYLDLIGDRYMELKRGDGEGADRVLPAGGPSRCRTVTRAGPRRADRRFPAVVPGAGSGQGQHHRVASSRSSRARAAPSTTSSTRPPR